MPGKDRRGERGTELDVTGSYNEVFMSRKRTGARTSLIVDPPSRRLPPLTPEAQKIAAADREFRLALLRATETWEFITFDPPGSTYTVPSGITPAGVITGYYSDKSGVQHGFLRTRAGAFTTFDPPGSTSTQPTAITPAGVIVGGYCDVAATICVGSNFTRGFVRMPSGIFTTFSPPSGGVFAGIYNPGGPPPGINPAGVIVGTYGAYTPSLTEHGFLLTPGGTLTTFDPPSSIFTEVTAINQAGVIIGDYYNGTASHGFLRAPDGTVTTFDAPPGSTQGTIPMAINQGGVITGATASARAFLRYSDGTTITFGPSDAYFVQPVSINPAGAVTGFFLGPSEGGGFLRAPDGTFTTLNPPGSTFTEAYEINPAGLIIGSFNDRNGVTHGFLFLPKN
jgi:uncharacterized membrane protein